MVYKPYKEYKEVDLPWLERVPSHWEMEKVKYKFDLVKEPSSDENPTVLSLTQKGIKVRNIESNEGQLAKSYEGYNTIKKGYICLNPMDLESGAAAKSEYEGVISNAYFTIKPKFEDINTDFYSKYFNLHYKKKIFYGFGKGVGRPEGSGGRWTLNRETFINFPIIFPPKEEQDKIVEFLDYQLEKIDGFIDLRERQIALFEEEKEVLINDAVTKGIDKDVIYKDSGIDWLGEIPDHWEIIRLKYLVDIKTGNKDTIDRVDNGDFPFFVRSPIVEKIDTFDYDGEAILTAGDGVGAGKVFHHYIGKFNYHQRVYNIHNIRGDILGRYLFYYLKQNFKKLILAYNAKSTVDSIRLPMLANFPIVYPDKDEQKSIVAYIEKETSKIDKTIELYKKQIDLIKEYRTSLISHAVTGKIDVRDFQEVK